MTCTIFKKTALLALLVMALVAGTACSNSGMPAADAPAADVTTSETPDNTEGNSFIDEAAAEPTDITAQLVGRWLIDPNTIGDLFSSDDIVLEFLHEGEGRMVTNDWATTFIWQLEIYDEGPASLSLTGYFGDDESAEFGMMTSMGEQDTIDLRHWEGEHTYTFYRADW